MNVVFLLNCCLTFRCLIIPLFDAVVLLFKKGIFSVSFIGCDHNSVCLKRVSVLHM